MAPYRTADQKLAEVKPVTTEQLHEAKQTKIAPAQTPTLTKPSPPPAQPILPIHSVPANADLDTKARHFDRMVSDLKKHVPVEYEFRVIASEWTDLQMCDVCLTTYNLPKSLDFNDVYLLRTQSDKEYYVNVRLINGDEIFPHNIYPSVEMNSMLMKHLNVTPLERITLVSLQQFDNTVERIELSPDRKVTYNETKDIEVAFKQFIVDNTKLFPVLINQEQWFVLPGCMVTVTIWPEALKFCVLDSEMLRRCRVQCVEKVTVPPKCDDRKDVKNGKDDEQCADVALEKYEEVISRSVNYLKMFLCLDERNNCRKVHNILIEGNENSGKSMVCRRIFEKLKAKPFYCHTDVFQCAQHQGRKVSRF